MSVPARSTRGVSAHRDPKIAGRLAVLQALRDRGAADEGTLLLFASGPHGASGRAIAEGAREVAPESTIAVVGSPRIASADDLEVSAGGVAAIALPVQSAASVAGGDYSDDSLSRLAHSIAEESARPALIFGRSRPGTRVALDVFRERANASRVGGALGTGAGLAVASPGGEIEEGDLLALRLRGGAGLVESAASSAEPLVPFVPVTSVRRGYVERIGDRLALDWLRDSGRTAPEGKLLLALLKGAEAESEEVLVRGVAGIDPTRGAIHLGEDVAVGERIALGAPAGRLPPEVVERACRSASRGLRGGAPRAAILVDPAGRTSRASFAETWDFSRRFGEIPWVGIRAAMQIVTVEGRPRVAQQMTTLALLSSAS